MNFHLCIFICLTLILTPTILAESGFHPCHPNKDQGHGVRCRKIVLPPALCSSCKLKATYPNGKYKDCRSIYNLDSIQCRNQLIKYAKWNAACDPIRVKQMSNLRILQNRYGLDYFLYAVCGHCCDCIPKNSNQDQFVIREKKNQLFNIDSESCRTHTKLNVCHVWPNVKFVSTIGMTDEYQLPRICLLLNGFLRTKQNKKLRNELNTVMDGFLMRFVRAAQCGARQTWTQCAKVAAKKYSSG